MYVLVHWNLLAIDIKVLRSVAGPFLSKMVTSEVAPDQVMLNGTLAVMPVKEGLVNSTARASARVVKARRRVVNCISRMLMGVCGILIL